jgi:hypothetical protein
MGLLGPDFLLSLGGQVRIRSHSMVLMLNQASGKRVVHRTFRVVDRADNTCPRWQSSSYLLLRSKVQNVVQPGDTTKLSTKLLAYESAELFVHPV